jgi:16S rRNA (guanine(966)-N(2))-methyltransferase RsmD
MSGSLRVIAGSLKGRRLKSGEWEDLRPTSEKLRETLFNVIASKVPGARVMDGFAGTGALGIEAISRGAEHVVFVESARAGADLIAENLERCGIATGYTVVRAPFMRAVDRLRTSPEFVPFDVILLDPPYDLPGTDKMLRGAASLAARDGLVIFEHARRQEAPEGSPDLARIREIVSGDSSLTFYALR